jgi:uncharacterized protein YdeI (YjbR/CyaY-like superfamily)
MASVHVDPGKVLEFEDAQSFYRWLGANHGSESEVWIKIHKVGSGLKSITPKEAIDVGRMTAHGLRQVELAKADGRWERAYASGKDMVLPEDLLAAVEAEPEARKTLAKLNAQNRFALAFRLHNMKTEAGRKRKIAAFVDMLKRGETIYPQLPG